MTWATRMVPGFAPDGGHILSVVAKKTYTFVHDEVACEDQVDTIDFIEADTYWGGGNPTEDSAKEEAENVAWKNSTDVVFIGNACAPRGKRARFFDAGIGIGNFRKVVRVFGDRKLLLKTFGFDFSEPELFESMPLHYGLAYGGRQKSSTGDELVYPRNPVGKGYVVEPDPRFLAELVLPNLENPAQLLTPENLVCKSQDRWFSAPRPWALGYTSRNFHPRLSYAGLPLAHALPGDISRLQAKQADPSGSAGGPTPVQNLEFFSGASEGLALPFLKGDEQVVLQYMDPDVPLFRFGLPGNRPSAWIDVGDGLETMDMVLQNVVIYKGTNQVTMVWRGSCAYAGPESMAEWETLRYGAED